MKKIIRIKNTTNKYKAIRTKYKGRTFDSRAEATKAFQLDCMKVKGEIFDWTPQFRIVLNIYDSKGLVIDSIKHRVDFCVTNLDGTYTLIEIKGVETQRYKIIRRLIEKVWVAENSNYKYVVEYVGNKKK